MATQGPAKPRIRVRFPSLPLGELAERLNALVLKTSVPQGTQGSNP
jgi:hypothetical protein